MIIPENVRAIAEQAFEKHDDVKEALVEVEKVIRKLPGFPDLVNALIANMVRDLVHDARRKAHVRRKKEVYANQQERMALKTEPENPRNFQQIEGESLEVWHARLIQQAKGHLTHEERRDLDRAQQTAGFALIAAVSRSKQARRPRQRQAGISTNPGEGGEG